MYAKYATGYMTRQSVILTAPGTPFEDLPDDWVCPICGVGKDQFAPV